MARIMDMEKEFPEININSIGEGILMPVLQNRWRVFFELASADDRNLVSRQIVRCSIDYVKKVFRVEIEQDLASGTLHTIFHDLCSHKIHIHVQALAGDGEPVHSIKLVNCLLEEHSFELDYAESNVAMHNIVFKFETVIPYERTEARTTV